MKQHMANNIITPAPGYMFVRAYCTDCGKLLMESNPLTKKQLVSNWNNTVMGALSISCKDCGNKAPNFHIELRIYNKRFNTEVLPEKYKPLKLTKAEMNHTIESFTKAFQLKAEKFKQENPEQARAIDERVLETKVLDITESGEVYEQIPPEEIMDAIQVEIKRRNELFNRIKNHD